MAEEVAPSTHLMSAPGAFDVDVDVRRFRNRTSTWARTSAHDADGRHDCDEEEVIGAQDDNARRAWIVLPLITPAEVETDSRSPFRGLLVIRAAFTSTDQPLV